MEVLKRAFPIFLAYALYLGMIEASVINLLKNGDFEKVTEVNNGMKLAGRPEKWILVSPVIASTIAQTGSFSAFVVNATSNSTCLYQMLEGNFSRRTFLVSGWIKPWGLDQKEALNIQITAQFSFHEVTQSLIIGKLSHGWDSWKRFMYLLTFPGNITSKQVKIAVETGATTSNVSKSFYVDSLVMEEYDPLSNYVENGDFEHENMSPWKCNGRKAQCRRSSIAYFSGSYSLEVSGKTKGFSQVIDKLLASNTYALSVWYFVSKGNNSTCSPKMKISFEFTKSNRRRRRSITTLNLASEDWMQVKPSLNFLEGSKGPFQLDVVIERDKLKSCKVYLDNFVLTQDWRTRSNLEIEQVRKRDVELIINHTNLESISGRIHQLKLDFPLGSAIGNNILSNMNYRDTFLNNFNYAVLENELKWAFTERVRDNINYQEADEMLSLLDTYNIPCRGHTVYGAMKHYIPDWVDSLSRREFKNKLQDRAKSVVSHFKNRLVSWDVHNEILHGRYIRDKLHMQEALPWLFQQVRNHDRDVGMFLNDYDILTNGASLDEYLEQIQTLQSAGVDLAGIGAQGHFDPHMFISYDVLRRRLDKLSGAGLPIWLSEVDVQDPDEDARADRLETIVRAAFSHPHVQGLLLWGFWGGSLHFPNTALWDTDWRGTAAGNRWRSLLAEWRTNFAFSENDTTEGSGINSTVLKFRGFFGSYNLMLYGKTYYFQIEPGVGKKVIRVNFNNDTVISESRINFVTDRREKELGSMPVYAAEQLERQSSFDECVKLRRELHAKSNARIIYILLLTMFVALFTVLLLYRIRRCRFVSVMILTVVESLKK